MGEGCELKHDTLWLGGGCLIVREGKKTGILWVCLSINPTEEEAQKYNSSNILLRILKSIINSKNSNYPTLPLPLGKDVQKLCDWWNKSFIYHVIHFGVGGESKFDAKRLRGDLQDENCYFCTRVGSKVQIME